MICNSGTCSDVTTLHPYLPAALHSPDHNIRHHLQQYSDANRVNLILFFFVCSVCGCENSFRPTWTDVEILSLKKSQIRAILHPTGERHEQRWSESRSERGRRWWGCMCGWLYRWRVNRDRFKQGSGWLRGNKRGIYGDERGRERERVSCSFFWNKQVNTFLPCGNV